MSNDLPAVSFREWELSAPPELQRDPIWRVTAYRLAVYLREFAWGDGERVLRHPLGRDVAPQLVRAIGSIAANISDGYSRAAGQDRARFFEYALSSTREGREWYVTARSVFDPHELAHRLNTLEEIIRLLLTMIPNERSRKIRKRKPIETEPDRARK